MATAVVTIKKADYKYYPNIQFYLTTFNAGIKAIKLREALVDVLLDFSISTN